MLSHSLAKVLVVTFSATIVHAQSAPGPGGTNPKAKGATTDITPGAGPNGSEDWLNTGLKGNGWTPPSFSLDDLVHIDTATFYGGVGSTCEQFDSYFQSSASKYNIDAAILACIAMQESSCNANPDPSNGTPGLMQVDCSNYPNGVCTDSIQDNVDAAANLLVNLISQYDGNCVHAFGSYNGWFTADDYSGLNNGKGLTTSYPCSSEGKSNGSPQNLDYLQELLNGWFQGLDVYGDDDWIGTYKCSGTCDNNAIC